MRRPFPEIETTFLMPSQTGQTDSLSSTIEVDAVRSPDLPPDDVDRDYACKEALAGPFTTLLLSAEQAGWNSDETAMALFTLAVSHLKAREARRRTASSVLRSKAALDRIVGASD